MHSFYRAVLLAGAITLLASSALAEDIVLNWLDKTPPALAQGVSFGVPWPKGAVKKDQSFVLTAADGKILPVQNWTLAYWPDGSIKWTGLATVAGPSVADPLKLALGNSNKSDTSTATPSAVVQVKETNEAVEIDTGVLKCRIPRQGPYLIDSMTIDGRVVARQGRLVCIAQNAPDADPANPPPREEYQSSVKKVTVEQSGPVRAVVIIEGTHKAEKGDRQWLPFYVRLYFYAGQEPVRMVHSFVFDGDQDKDFIRGLGVAFAVPMREQVQNRHVRFSGEGAGLWVEPIQPLTGRSILGGRGGDPYRTQFDGKRVPNREELNVQGQGMLANWAVWDSYKLVQPNADGFTIQKRTNPQSSWLAAAAGKRASGLVFIGDVSGGLAVSVRNFWQSFPASLEVQKASTEEAELHAWLWSPDAPGMDLRHYDTKAHDLNAAYEDVQPGFSTPTGIARTSELMLYPSADVPAKADTVRQSQFGSQPPLLVCTPQYLHSVQALGLWSVQDRSTAIRGAIEDRLDAMLAYYLKQVEDRHWYGFWNYGDVMHAYDPVRHVWRYDIGGYAWDNSELGTDLWLWYSFLRSGRADLFRMAEAMTRHTGEVDCYHQGRFAGLGSRHNVSHWGDGAKEARISQAAYRRFYYYLTTDERTGDVMREMLNADYKTVEFDPMRLASPPTPDQKKYPTRVRLGPDWLAFVSNWMTEWERTGDTKWRDKIYAGMDCLAQMPLGFRSGRDLLFGYDPDTGKLFQLTDVAGDYNLARLMGGPEVVFELNALIDHSGWQKVWLQYCKLRNAPANVILQDMKTGAEGANANYANEERLAAYYGTVTKNPAFLQSGLRYLTALGGSGGAGARGGARGGAATRRIEGPEVLNPLDESAGVSTNDAAQMGWTTIELLEMCGHLLPGDPPAAK
jgi:hypothetical protein